MENDISNIPVVGKKYIYSDVYFNNKDGWVPSSSFYSFLIPIEEKIEEKPPEFKRGDKILVKNQTRSVEYIGKLDSTPGFTLVYCESIGIYNVKDENLKPIQKPEKSNFRITRYIRDGIIEMIRVDDIY